MVGKKIRVLVVDDSPLMREMISDSISADPKMEVVGTAPDGLSALERVPELAPDVVTLDIQMPKMDGLQTLGEILRRFPRPVVMVSSLTQRTADTTLRALDLGALDYVAKPDSLNGTEGVVQGELLHKIRAVAGADVERVIQARRARQARRALPREVRSTSALDQSWLTTRCIAIGISTGGPPALSSLFQSLHAPLPPILVVQHMPSQFTGPFAQRLNSLSELTVKEAAAGDVLQPNHAFVAPGGKHMSIRKRGSRISIQITDDEPVSSHKPSVDVMMDSVAAIYGSGSLGVIMTGMGRDGASGCGELRSAGGFVLGQDQASSDVYGMNKVAHDEGHVDQVVSLDALPEALMSLATSPGDFKSLSVR